MKIKNIKHYVLGIITGVSIVFVSAFAAGGGGTIGSLFEKVGTLYFLKGENISVESITTDQILIIQYYQKI